MSVAKPLSGLKIGWDLDGVMYDFVQSFYDHSPIDAWKPPTNWDEYHYLGGLEYDDFVKIFYDAIHTGIMFRDYPPLQDSHLVFNEMADLGAEMVIISARNVIGCEDIAEVATIEWLQDHDIRFDRLILCEDKTVHPTDYFIEDNPHNIFSLKSKEYEVPKSA